MKRGRPATGRRRKARLSLRLDDAVLDRINEGCARRNLTKTEYLERLARGEISP